ncbi:MAG: hypothetical protein J6V90_04860 [Treponema sp.]|nr:hypothetical protein [Treponema sp.]
MKKIFFATAIALASLALTACASSNKLYDLKNKDLSAPAQNAVRICNMLTWVYNTCSDYKDMSETLAEIGITREELQTMKFSGNYDKPFGRQFTIDPTYSDESKIYFSAKRQAQKMAKLILANLPPEESEPNQ